MTKANKKAATKKVLGWWFGPSDDKLRYGDGRTVKKGVTHKLSAKHELSKCSYGLHACEHLIEALEFSNFESNTLWRVELTDPAGNEYERKMYAKERKYLFKVENAFEVIRGILYAEAKKNAKLNGVSLTSELYSYMDDPQPSQHSALHKTLKALENERRYYGHRSEPQPSWDLFKAIQATIPARNKDTFIPIDGLCKLYNHLTYVSSSTVEDNTPSSEDILAALRRMIGAPRTKLERIVKEKALDEEQRNSLGNWAYHLRHELMEKQNIETRNKLQGKLFKELEKESK
jgi:hypothetical protein